MATQVFFRARGGQPAANDYSTANNDARLSGANVGWDTTAQWLEDVRSAGPLITYGGAFATVAGPTNGIEMSSGAAYRRFISAPLAADVTISGTITINIWAWESSMSANAAINCAIYKIDGATGAITQIAKSARTTELGTSSAAANFTVTPTSTACKRGDRIIATPFIDDAGTMASGFTCSMTSDAASAGVDGDSYVTFTETFTFETSDPAGTTIYLTDVASDVVTASTDLEAWTSRGDAAVASDNTATVNGWTAPIQIRDGGAVADWFTKPLAAFTLGGGVLCNIRATQSNISATASIGVEIAIVNGDGSSPTVWAINRSPEELSTTQSAFPFWVSGDDIAVSDGQRLRIRLISDDTSDAPMVTGFTVNVAFDGPTPGADGDTYLTFSQTLTIAPTSGGFTANAVIKREQTGSITLDAVLRREQTSSFTANAVIKRTISSTFTANASLRRTQTGSFTLDAVVLRTFWFGDAEAGF